MSTDISPTPTCSSNFWLPGERVAHRSRRLGAQGIDAMTKPLREQRRLKFKATLANFNLTQEEAAAILRVSPSTITAWLKPATSKSSNPVPEWAFRLLRLELLERHDRPD
jgi:DNA-binding XRE family transcriptional regulator